MGIIKAFNCNICDYTVDLFLGSGMANPSENREIATDESTMEIVVLNYLDVKSHQEHIRFLRDEYDEFKALDKHENVGAKFPEAIACPKCKKGTLAQNGRMGFWD